MNVYCLFSLESPRLGDSNEYTKYTISQNKTENHPILSQICIYGIFSKGPKNEFETAVVNKKERTTCLGLALNSVPMGHNAAFYTTLELLVPQVSINSIQNVYMTSSYLCTPTITSSCRGADSKHCYFHIFTMPN